MTLVFKLARRAMGTRFEFLLCGDAEGYLRSVAEEALDEVERLDEQLSVYNPTSEVSDINAHAAYEPVRVEPRLFKLLERAARLTAETDGAFDITVAPLVRCWGFLDGGKHVPSRAEIEKALRLVGMHNVELSPSDRTVRFAREGVAIDLGGIGKGYAIKCAAEIVREHGIGSALLHGGTSTIYAIGSPPDAEAWSVGIVNPLSPGEPKERLAVVHLKDRALSVSSWTGKSVEAAGRRCGHILDPRTGRPAQGVLSAAVIGPSPTETDALSTAFCVLGEEKARAYCEKKPDIGVTLVIETEEKPRLIRCGLACSSCVLLNFS